MHKYSEALNRSRNKELNTENANAGEADLLSVITSVRPVMQDAEQLLVAERSTQRTNHQSSYCRTTHSIADVLRTKGRPGGVKHAVSTAHSRVGRRDGKPITVTPQISQTNNCFGTDFGVHLCHKPPRERVPQRKKS